DEITTGSSSKHDLSSGLAEIGSLGRDRTDYPRESVRVAIHAGATGYKLLDQLNAAGDIHAVRVTGEEIDTLEELAAYDVVILGDETVEAEMDGFAPALRTWVETAQGGVIGTGWLIYAAGAFTGDPVADIDAIIPIDLTAPEYYTFGGTVHREPVSHPITLVTPDFQLNSDYEFADGPIDDGATTLATVGGVPFVVAANPGSGGRSVWLAPAYFDDSDTNQVRTGPAATLLTRAVYWAGAVGPDRGDFYKIYTPPGDTVVISTETPGGDLLNTLVPTIELYAPTGELVASNSRGADDGRNARLEYSIPAEVNGYYSVRVSTESGSGDYVLRASGGYEIPDAPLTLSAFSPANGAVLTTFPSTITLFASEALNFSSLSADDVTINGQPATSVARQGGRGLSINTAGFNTGDGIYTVAIAGGALRDLQGQPNVAFSMTFTYDSAAPASSVEELPATVIGTDVNLHWSGTDAGAGIATYSIYVSDNDGPYTPFLLNTTSTSAVFVGEDQHTYRFYSVATDQVGRIEAAPEFPDAVTTVQVNGYSPVFTSPDNFEIAENSTEVAVVTATDDDVPVQTVTFSITGGADQSLFSISSDGVLTFNSAPDFENPEDADGDNVYEIQLTADDGLGGTAVQDLTIFVSPVNEFRPEFHSPDSVTVPENSTAILTADATDDDLPVQSVSFSIVGGADEAWFQITPRGILSFVTPRNFEQPVDANGDNLYEVQILADDGDGGTTLQDITVQVTNVNESPVGLALSPHTIGEILPA
ncbi:MAG: cadherin domain-containing protein, partial [Planctomycetota bacterium]|nr:cadherin domain-containing protein [Planctomycetota bacterium]